MENAVAIKKINDDFEECTKVIRDSFITVARQFNITRENAPTNPAFAEADSLVRMKEKGIEMFGAYRNNACIGFVAVEKAGGDVFYMERLAVLPEYRHQGLGAQLIGFAEDHAKACGGKKISIGIINANTVLKNWYSRHGFIETNIKQFKHLPFDVCFMEKGLTNKNP